jgi:23S rRNA pseudouridine2457 synthase
MLIAFNKPYGVLSRFMPDGSPNRTLAEFGLPKGVYPIGRLDADSEGLLFLSDEAGWNAALLDPERGHEREYWAQVERVPDPWALRRLCEGVVIQGRRTRPAQAWMLDPQPQVPPRDPPILPRRSLADVRRGLQPVVQRRTQGSGRFDRRARVGSVDLHLPPALASRHHRLLES